MLPWILEACENRMQTTKLLNSYMTEMAENSISERAKFSGGACPQTSLQENTDCESNLHPSSINLTALHTVKLFQNWMKIMTNES